MLKQTLRLLFLWAVLESVCSRGCSSFFCRKSRRVSGSHFGVDPGKPLMLTPYLEQGKIEEGMFVVYMELFQFLVYVHSPYVKQNVRKFIITGKNEKECFFFSHETNQSCDLVFSSIL